MLSLEEARKALGWEGRRLSDDQVRERAEQAHALAEIFVSLGGLDAWQAQRDAKRAAPKRRRSKAA